MKITIQLLVCLLFLTQTAFSQRLLQPIVETEESSFNYEEFQNIFSNFDRSNVKSGLLSDKGIELVKFDDYNGSKSSNIITHKQWKLLYSQLSSIQTEKDIYIKPINDFKINTLENALNTRNTSQNESYIPIGILDFQYNSLKKDAARKGVLSVKDNKLIVSVGRNQNDYLTTHSLFAASAMKEDIYNGSSVKFVFDKKMYLSNISDQRDLFYVDFGDGQGKKQIKLDEVFEVNYESVGEKQINLIKQSADSKLSKFSSFKVNVRALRSPSPNLTISLSKYVPSSYPNGGVTVKGQAYVYTSDGSTNIDNPIIICEGFDPTNERGRNELYDLLNRQNFIERYLSCGYDFVILNFNNGGDYIERNAYVLKTLIEDINNRKTTDNELIVVGASMGGLVSRYALAYMENANIEHHTRLFVSFDSPQGGANIPLGIQHWLKFFAEMNDEVEDSYNDILCSKAARQMLIYHSEYSPDPTNNSYRQNFLSNLNSLGYPEELKKIAIANGSGTAIGLKKNDGTTFNPGAQIVSWNYSHWATVDIKGNSWAVPNITRTKIFHGLVDKTWLAQVFTWDFVDKENNTYMSNSKPYDNAPGGTRTTAADIAASDTDGKGDITTEISKHCFIPTISALDINTSNLFYNVDQASNILSLTPFDNIYYPQTSEEHVYISEACVGWIKNELVPNNLVLDGSGVGHWDEGVVRAGNSIKMLPGFSVKAGNNFSTKISTLNLPASRLADNYSMLDTEQKEKPNIELASIESDLSSFNLYPNPTEGLVKVSANNSTIEYIEIRDIRGNLVRKISKSDFNGSFSLNDYANGIYLISVFVGNKTSTQKILKQ
jgi:hypothetical protein